MAMTIIGSSLWVSYADPASPSAPAGVSGVAKIDLPSRSIVDPFIATDNNPVALANDGNYVWTANLGDSTLTKIDPVTDTVVDTVDLGVDEGPTSMAFDGTTLWVQLSGPGILAEIDPQHDLLTEYYGVSFNDIQSASSVVAFDGEYLWVGTSGSPGTLVEIDPVNGAIITQVPVNYSPSHIAVDGGTLWLSDSVSCAISRFDIATLAVTDTIYFGDPAVICTSDLAVGGGYLWATGQDSSSVWKIDTRTDAIVEEYLVGSTPTGVIFDGTDVWVANNASDSLSIITP